MTEKRFECDKGSRIIIDNETKLHYIMTFDWECSLVTKLLNRFAEENEQLKSENQRVSEQKHIYKQDWKHLCIDKELLDSENEQLKQKIKSIKEILNEDIGYIESLRKIEGALK